MIRSSIRKILPVVMLLACQAAYVKAAPACKQAFYILPVVGGVGAVELAGLKGAPEGFSSLGAVRAMLEKLEPGGPHGRVQVGYTLPLPMLSLFKKQAGKWVFDDERLGFYLELIRNLDRPVAVVLLSNHFSDASPLVHELAQDPVNLMQLADGSPPTSRYFSTEVIPFTLSTDASVPVNHYRFTAMRKTLEALTGLDKAYPGRLVAVTLGGETHHLFNDLRGGTGKYDGAQYSDYSPLAKQEFRAWLQKRYKRVEDYNRVAGTPFKAWAQVEPPSKDIRRHRLDGFFQHFDAYAPGYLPVYGWVHPKHMPASIEVWVDGWHVGNAVYGVNRQDVYEARQDIATANVGYRYDLDHSRLSAGEHVIQVIVNGERDSRLLSETRLVVMTADQRAPSGAWWRTLLAKVRRKMQRAGSIDGWADAPREMADVYFNPAARIWQTFREFQVASLIDAYANTARSAGFDPTRIYSHQLQPWWNGSWNDVLFATGKTPGVNAGLQPGITMYGGLTTNAALLGQHAQGRRYGVPELNLLSKGQAGDNKRMLEFHAAQCAGFISPYYFDILPVALRPKDDHNRMLIDENAPTPGGREAYQSMKERAAW